MLGLVAVLSATAAEPFSVEIKDKNGIPILGIDGITIGTFSAYFKEHIPSFAAKVTNVSGLPLNNVEIEVRAILTNGTSFTFTPVDITGPLGDIDAKFNLKDKASVKIQAAFEKPWPFRPDSMSEVEISAKWSMAWTEKGMRFDGFLAKDKPCLRDYVQATLEGGLAGRKKIAELLTYGCGEAISSKPQASIEKAESILVNGKKDEALLLFLSDDLAELKSSSSTVMIPKIGWGVRSALTPADILTWKSGYGLARSKVYQ